MQNPASSSKCLLLLLTITEEPLFATGCALFTIVFLRTIFKCDSREECCIYTSCSNVIKLIYSPESPGTPGSPLSPFSPLSPLGPGVPGGPRGPLKGSLRGRDMPSSQVTSKRHVPWFLRRDFNPPPLFLPSVKETQTNPNKASRTSNFIF